MNEIKVVPLGAGQDVGRSCILVSIGGKNVMFDCGMHMGYNNEKRFPDFSYITRSKNVDEYLDCVIISHFHLDHCGALPYFTEMVGYNGPVYMTHPTKAIVPILLEDYRKITVDKRGDHGFFTQEMIGKSMKKVRCVNLHEVVKVDDELEIQPFYAGHVLGAAMFLIRVGKLSVLYTGDYNMTPDRHLGAAWVSKCEPNLLITESTYATTIRDSKRIREREFLEKIHNTLLTGGKVLIPVFALGRAQELCIMLETYWERMNLRFPVYFCTGMVEKANEYYKLFISWTNEKIKETFVERNMFEFKHIKTLPQGTENNNEPMVVFATPGMLHAGQSLNIFKKWAGNEKNMVIIPGYCVAGTVGYKIQSKVKKIEFDKQTIDVRLKVEYLSFSAHADAKGIMDLINQCKPRNVMLVHGEAQKMDFLKARIEHEFKVKCYKPANGEMITIKCDDRLYCNATRGYLRKCLDHQNSVNDDEMDFMLRKNKPFKSGIIIRKSNGEVNLMDRPSAITTAGLVEHHLQFTSTVKFISKHTLADIMSHLVHFLKSIFNTESGHEIHCQEESFTIGPLEDPLVTILVKESTLAASVSATEEPGASLCSPADAQIFDVLRVTSDQANGQSAFESLQSARQVCLHVTYSFQEEPMGSRLYAAIQVACAERRLEFVS